MRNKRTAPPYFYTIGHTQNTGNESLRPNWTPTLTRAAPRQRNAVRRPRSTFRSPDAHCAASDWLTMRASKNPVPAQKIDASIQTCISPTSHTLGLTASTINGKHVMVSKILLTPACLTIAPMSIRHGASGTAAISACFDRSSPFTDRTRSRD